MYYIHFYAKSLSNHFVNKIVNFPLNFKRLSLLVHIECNERFTIFVPEVFIINFYARTQIDNRKMLIHSFYKVEINQTSILEHDDQIIHLTCRLSNVSIDLFKTNKRLMKWAYFNRLSNHQLSPTCDLNVRNFVKGKRLMLYLKFCILYTDTMNSVRDILHIANGYDKQKIIVVF